MHNDLCEDVGAAGCAWHVCHYMTIYPTFLVTRILSCFKSDVVFFSFIFSRYLIAYTECVGRVEFYIFVYRINEQSYLFLFLKNKRYWLVMVVGGYLVCLLLEDAGL